MREQHRRSGTACSAGSLELLVEAFDVLERELSGSLGALSLSRRAHTRISAEHDNIEEGVAHEAVSAVDTARDLARRVEVLNVGSAVNGDIETAVLVVESRVHEDRLLADVDAVLAEHTHHRGDALLDSALAVLELNHRSIEPYRLAEVSLDALAALCTFADN